MVFNLRCEKERESRSYWTGEGKTSSIVNILSVPEAGHITMCPFSQGSISSVNLDIPTLHQHVWDLTVEAQGQGLNTPLLHFMESHSSEAYGKGSQLLKVWDYSPLLPSFLQETEHLHGVLCWFPQAMSKERIYDRNRVRRTFWVYTLSVKKCSLHRN